MASLQLEGVLIISCDDLPAEKVISQILKKEDLPEEVTCHSVIKGYPWAFETKYYSAEVFLYAAKEKETIIPEFSEFIKAVVFYFDDTKSSSFDEILEWIPYLKDIEAEVQLLICNNRTEEPKDRRKNILNWCVRHQYELIELNSSSEDDEEECPIRDVTGYNRVIQSLQSHPWANLIMKDDKHRGKENRENKELKDSALSEASSAANINSEIPNPDLNAGSEKNIKKAEKELEGLDQEDRWLANVLNDEDPNGESFEALFTRFADMKERAACLSGDERKKYAEKMAIAFWRAMGGDEDEIAGLEDED